MLNPKRVSSQWVFYYHDIQEVKKSENGCRKKSPGGMLELLSVQFPIEVRASASTTLFVTLFFVERPSNNGTPTALP